MNSLRVKLGFAALAIVVIFVFQNCSSSSFSPIASSTGDVTDPERLNNKKCEYDGNEFWHGDTIQTYAQSSVAFGNSCVAQTHTCNNGIFSGTIGFKNCGVGVPRDCLIGTETITHNTESIRFEAALVAHNQSCRSEVRKCFDGSIPGSYTLKKCAVQAPPTPLNEYSCVVRAGQSDNQVMDLHRKWSDGTTQKVETCSNWQSTRDNSGGNCGKLTNGIYGQYTTSDDQPSCCPAGKTTVNGLCMPVAQQGQACYGSNNCDNGFECRGNEATTATNPFGRRCQPK